MMLRPCPREREVKEQMQRGLWPDGSAEDLRRHVSGCRACGELVVVMQAFRSARASSVSSANPSSAGVLWWRAQLRRRNAAMEQIARPILGAQIFALAVTIAIAVILAVSQANHGLRWLAWLKQLGQTPALHFENLWSSALAMPQWGLMLLIFGLAGIAVLGGVVLFSDRQRQ
ncbi:MAG TPA: hypothetical protein VLZ50_08280 [Terracidiphilus sp.]|nr:hypothetical protein [Terracidiphilus sp.]